MMKNKNVPKIRFKGFVEEWEETTLGNIADIVGGGTPSTSIKEYWEGDINWYSPAEIGKNVFVDKSLRNITEQGLNNCSAQILPVGTVLFSSRAGIGSVAILAKEAATNQGFQSILPHKRKLDSYFIYSRSRELKRYGETNGAGSTFVEVSGKQMACMPIINPSIEEQTHIGNFFQNIDNLIHLNQKKLEKLKNFKKASLEKMFPKKGATIPEIRFKGFSGEWEETKFGEIATIRRGLTYNPSNIVKEGIRVLRSSNIDEDTFILSKDDVFVSKDAINIDFVDENDILITSANGSPRLVGKHAIIKGIDTHTTVHGGFMLLATTTQPHFVNAFMSSDWYTKFLNLHVAGGNGSIGNLNKNDLEIELVRIPKNINEQIEIGSYFYKLDHLITKQQTQLTQLKNIKKACLDKMFVTKE